jgi:pyruvate dehydrogenase E1 component alpha subunit
MPGVTVDGQSAIEIYEVAGEAVARARKGEGPTLIEAETYRYGGHFGADDPLGYRSEEEEAHYKERDCIRQLTAHILEGGYAGEEQLQKLEDDALERIARAVKFADESPFPDPSELLEDVYVSYR